METKPICFDEKNRVGNVLGTLLIKGIGVFAGHPVRDEKSPPEKYRQFVITSFASYMPIVSHVAIATKKYIEKCAEEYGACLPEPKQINMKFNADTRFLDFFRKMRKTDNHVFVLEAPHDRVPFSVLFVLGDKAVEFAAKKMVEVIEEAKSASEITLYGPDGKKIGE